MVHDMKLLLVRYTMTSYKMKYWQGVNFGDWQLLDKSPTFNLPVPECICVIFCVTLQLQNGVASVF